jgi:hypothetical protein
VRILSLAEATATVGSKTFSMKENVFDVYLLKGQGT